MVFALKVLKLVRNFFLALAGFALLIIAIGTAQAAGALAVGVCGAYGYGFDYGNVKDASDAAMSELARMIILIMAVRARDQRIMLVGLLETFHR